MLQALRSAAPALVAALCLIVLTVRISGVHAHRDLAGAPQSIAHEHGHHSHGHHHGDSDHDVFVDHADGEVDVKVDALTGLKLPGKTGAVLAAVLFVAALCFVQAPVLIPRPPDRTRLRSLLTFHWRPPLRGPPQISIA